MAQLKIYAKPSSLYRYRGLDENVDQELDALREGYIYCPAFSAMNDPMEGTYRISTRLSANTGGDKSPAKVQTALDAMGIASMSEVFDHEPMWAHYADEFKGICVQYSLNRLLKGLAPDIALTRMMYSEREPVLLDDRSDAVDRARLCLSSKTVRWASEREWRLFKLDQGPARYGDARAVTKIYLGSRIKPSDETAVLDVGRRLDVPVVKMAIEAYAITFKPLPRPTRLLRRPS
ncbi:DUF2971 domain-containing protein [Sphingomonas faeni]|uniref:DUF2971 domain-containing protein n=1 Tax=Sphingomonas faeni TaxID=185950 RepID=UPI00335D7715